MVLMISLHEPGLLHCPTFCHMQLDSRVLIASRCTFKRNTEHLPTPPTNTRGKSKASGKASQQSRPNETFDIPRIGLNWLMMFRWLKLTAKMSIICCANIGSSAARETSRATRMTRWATPLPGIINVTNDNKSPASPALRKDSELLSKSSKSCRWTEDSHRLCKFQDTCVIRSRSSPSCPYQSDLDMAGKTTRVQLTVWCLKKVETT